MSEIIADARDLARVLHAHQTRRESGLPFFDAHLVPVAEMVRVNGGDDLAIAAAWLHDAIEDVGEHTRAQIAAISPEILAIVEQLTESGEDWQSEKENYVSGVDHMDWRALLVSICDKTCNATNFVEEWQQGKFGKRPVQIIWFFGALLEAYEPRSKAIDRDYRALLWDLHALVGRLQELHITGGQQNGR